MSIYDELRAIGMSPEMVGLPMPDGSDSRSELLPFAWMLHPNRGGRHRVRAVAVTAAQFAELSQQRMRGRDSDRYIWRGFDLTLGVVPPVDASLLTHLYAVVDAEDIDSGLSITSKVRVREMHTTADAAEKSRAAFQDQYSHFRWAVVQYPVGQMLY